MQETFNHKNLKISLNINGANKYTKISYPLKYGIYSELETDKFIFHFNLNHEIIRAKSRDKKWIHPLEWLKRTVGNDWVYYSSGGYAGVFEAIGEYYLPNFQYPTNALTGGRPFKTRAVDKIIRTWHNELLKISESACITNEKIKAFLGKAAANSPDILQKKGEALYLEPKERVTVLPPDARHVDYNIIPLNISTGCLYNCRFCRVKTGCAFREKTKNGINEEIKRLKQVYAKDIVNYNAVFLGQHDALNADKRIVLYAAEKAYAEFNFKNSYIQDNYLFLFGSADSLLNAETDLFDRLNRLDYKTYINIGLESADQKTLDHIGKPLTEKKVRQAFQTICEINSTFENIEVTSNFVLDESLPAGHMPSFMALARESTPKVQSKGCIYLSPLAVNAPSREKMFTFNRIKTAVRFPTYLYIIQRL
ncbi:MAG: radical SAM protein [Desulfobacteraceae bacterium]